MEVEIEWKNLSEEKKEDCYKYLTLIRRFKKDPSLLSFKYKRWVLQNSDLPTYLIPNDVLDDKSLWLD